MTRKAKPQQAYGIYALSSARGRAGVAVIRASGEGVAGAVVAIAGKLPQPREATLRLLRDGRGNPLDRGLVLWFPAPTSFTGEDVAEFHVHGSPAVVAALLSALAQVGLRLASAGEFTRRAFTNGCMDLAQVEGLADLIDSETEGQRKQALAMAEGRTTRAISGWREKILRLLAQLEAAIDFPDEDLPAEIIAGHRAIVGAVMGDLRVALAGSGVAERVRDGIRIAIIGAPNVGKSSLLNALAGREAAIVSAIAGTTRDVLEVQLDLGGLALTLADTAGLRETADIVEREGVSRARRVAGEADLRLAVFDLSARDRFDSETLMLLKPGDVAVMAKSDLVSRETTAVFDSDSIQPKDGVTTLAISVKTGDGMAGLIAALAERALTLTAGAESAVITNARQAEALGDAAAALERALLVLTGSGLTGSGLTDSDPAVELAAEDLRLALRALGRVVGQVDVEDVLDLIFAEFCIGK